MQNLKRKTGYLVFYFIIAAQLFTGPFTIRKWPFTDYPMFSRAVDKSKPAEILFLVDHFDDTQVIWDRNASGSVGPFDLRLQAYKNKIEDPGLFSHIQKRVKDRNYSVKPRYVSVWKRTARVVNSKIEEDTQNMKTYEYKTLAD